jgi:hypothetical protein
MDRQSRQVKLCLIIIASNRIIAASRPMSTDARFQKRPISQAILPQPRRTEELSALPSHMRERVPAATRPFRYMRRSAIMIGILQAA